MIMEAKKYTVDGGTHAGVVVVFRGQQPDEGAVLSMWGEPLAVAGDKLVALRSVDIGDTDRASLDVAAIVDEWRRS